MFMLKVVTYCATIAAAMFFAFWELRLKRRLTKILCSLRRESATLVS
jgi:hypothetical protein